jgi:tRNA A-37 threonylcarbamoyl transferase component Bud32
LGRLGGFRILKVLGHGGMGVVFQAEDAKLGRPVAIKAMLPHLAGSKSAQERFLREARAAAALEHDHIVPILQVGEDQGAPFIVMPLLKGEPLDARLRRQEKLPVAEVLLIGREMAEGLAAAHARGLIHRDIKPGNVWLEDRSDMRPRLSPAEQRQPRPLVATEYRVKILDFGLARASAQESGLTQQGAIIGTPAYMAPEQARGQKVDARCDLWSLGVVLYRMCTGRLPFQGADTVATLMAVATHEPPPPARVNLAVPAGLSDLVMKLLEKDPARRLASAQGVAAALRQLEQARPLPAATASFAPASPGRSAPARRSRKPLLLALAGGLAAAVVAVVLFWPRPDATAPTAATERTSLAERLVRPPLGQPPPGLAPQDRASGPVIALLPLLNLQKDGLYGRWTATADGVTAAKDERSYLQFPYRPPSEYDFRVELTCRAGGPQVSVVLAGGGRSFAYVMGTTFGLGRIAGKKANINPTTLARRLTLNDRHVCMVCVRKDRVVVEVDGKQTADWKTDYSDLSYPPQAWKGRDRTLLGLASLDTETVLHRADVVEVAGRGAFTRPDDPAARRADAERSLAANGKEQ